jgi:hypothetical protein
MFFRLCENPGMRGLIKYYEKTISIFKRSYPTLYLWTIGYDSTLTNYWPVRNGLMNDYVGGADLTCQSPMFAADRLGNAQSALRTNTTYTYNAPTGTYFVGDMTVTAWWYVRNCVDWSGFMSFVVNGQYTIGMAITSGTTCIPFVNVAYGGPVISGSNPLSNTAITKNKWMHTAFTITGSTLVIYINGISVASTPTYTAINTSTTTNVFGWSADFDFNEIKFFSRGLTQQQIVNDMNLNQSYIITV